MNLERLAPLPRGLDDGGPAQVKDLFYDIKFAKSVELLGSAEVFELVAVVVVGVADMPEPVIDKAEFAVFEGSLNSAATVMSDDEDVFNFEDGNRKFDNAKAIKIGVNNEVCDIPVDKNFAGPEAHNLVGGNSGIATTDPKEFGGLLFSQFVEETWIIRLDILRPVAVLAKKVLDRCHQGS